MGHVSSQQSTSVPPIGRRQLTIKMPRKLPLSLERDASNLMFYRTD